MTLVKTARKISEEEIQSLNIIPSSQRSETAVNIHPITRTVLYPVCHVTRLAKFRFAFTGDLLIGENETKPVLTVPMRTFLNIFHRGPFFRIRDAILLHLAVSRRSVISSPSTLISLTVPFVISICTQM